MKPRHATQAFEINGTKAEHRQFEGRDHLVVPVVAVREGVLNGMLLLFDEFSAYPQAWEGIPLPVNHPKKGNLPVTANSPDILEGSVIGRFFNVIVDEQQKALKGELYVDVLKAQAHADGQEIINRLESGDKLEVSTAYFADMEDKAGVHNGKKYDGIQRNLRPDHLALLPHSNGACSWDDGCGAPRLNGDEVITNAVKYLVTEPDGKTHLPYTDQSGKPDHRLMGAAWAALHGGYRGNKYSGPDKEAAIQKLKAVYKSEGMPMPAMNEAIAITGEWIESFSQVLSITPAELLITAETHFVTNASKEEQVMDKKQLVDALIANEKTPWKETHREMLTALSDCELKGLQPNEAAPPTDKKDDKGIVVHDNVVVNKEVKPKTAAEWLDTIPDPRLKTMFQQGLMTHDSRKAELVDKLTANKACAFSKDELQGMELAFLEKVASTLDVSYEGAAPPRANRARVEVNEEVPEPPKVLTAPVVAK